MIQLALWIASALFLGYCALWVWAAIKAMFILLFEREEKLKSAAKRQERNAESGPGLSSYPPWD